MLDGPMSCRWVVVLLLVGCLRVRPPEEPVPEAPAPMPEPPAPTVVRPAEPRGLYTLEEALQDAFSGPWTYIGTGPWTGNQRVQACAYRNDRVIVVNVYCTVKEVKAFRVDVFSPTRGRVRIYAEAKAPISTIRRADYFTFNAESEPAPGARARLPPLTLAMSYSELLDYDGRRYRGFFSSCYGGMEFHRPQGGCLRELKPHARDWADTNRAFLREPPEDWYRIVRELRALALQHGRDPS
jgi:hypothetical protein